jgi:hypothetical protein
MKFGIKIDNSGMNDPLDALQVARDGWPQSKRDRFLSRWRRLEAHGCEMVEIKYSAGLLKVTPSPDFAAHLRAFGVAV